MVKLLSLADLGGLADLAEGEGLSFDLLEIKMQKKKFLELDEYFGLGPSIISFNGRISRLEDY